MTSPWRCIENLFSSRTYRVRVFFPCWETVDICSENWRELYLLVEMCVSMCVWRANSIPDNLHQFTRRTFFCILPVQPPTRKFFYSLSFPLCSVSFPSFFPSTMYSPRFVWALSASTQNLFRRRRWRWWWRWRRDQQHCSKKLRVGCFFPFQGCSNSFFLVPLPTVGSPFYDAIYVFFSFWAVLFIIRWYVRIFYRREPARAVYIFQIATVFSLVGS